MGLNHTEGDGVFQTFLGNSGTGLVSYTLTNSLVWGVQVQTRCEQHSWAKRC